MGGESTEQASPMGGMSCAGRANGPACGRVEDIRLWHWMSGVSFVCRYTLLAKVRYMGQTLSLGWAFRLRSEPPRRRRGSGQP